jgi:hypothetical protein
MTKNKNVTNQQGYIALMSAIIISAVLLDITFATSASGYFLRFNGLDQEYKRRSRELAEACKNIILLQLAEGSDSIMAQTVMVGNENCFIITVRRNVPVAGDITIQTRGVVRQAVTNLQVVVAASNFSLISWEELDSS